MVQFEFFTGDLADDMPSCEQNYRRKRRSVFEYQITEALEKYEINIVKTSVWKIILRQPVT
jgi:hypothetical protein